MSKRPWRIEIPCARACILLISIIGLQRTPLPSTQLPFVCEPSQMANDRDGDGKRTRCDPPTLAALKACSNKPLATKAPLPKRAASITEFEKTKTRRRRPVDAALLLLRQPASKSFAAFMGPIPGTRLNSTMHSSRSRSNGDLVGLGVILLELSWQQADGSILISEKIKS